MTDKFEEKLFRMAEREQICLPRSLEIKIDARLKSLPVPRRKVRVNLGRSLLVAAVLVMLFSITAVAAAGAVRQRMEAMNREKMEEYFVQVYTSKLPADNYNRPYREEERSRMKELQRAYEEEARFPQGEVAMIEYAADYKGKGVAFLKDTSTFFFPEKEMSDEQLLQIIDFYYKRDYSVQKMAEMAAQGEASLPEVQMQGEPTEADVLQSDAVLNPDQALTIPYTGDLSILYMAGGKDCIFLTGWNAVHKMEIGSSDSVLFFDDFDKYTRITALCQDGKGNVYMGLMQLNGEDCWESALWVLDQEGKFLRAIDLSPFQKKDISFGGKSSNGFIRQLAADNEGNLYIRGAGFTDADLLLIIDTQGNLVAKISFGEYTASMLGGIGIGKDGKAYTMVWDSQDRIGIASVNPKEGCLEEIYTGIVPDDTINLDIVAPGYDADFVFWGYDGIFSYNKGEDSAAVIMPAYETPCAVEGALYCALPDGRIVLASCTEYIDRETEEGVQVHDRVPEKTCFYYLPTLR